MGVKFWAGMGVGWVVKIDCDRAEVMVGGVAVEGVVWVGCVRYPVCYGEMGCSRVKVSNVCVGLGLFVLRGMG